MPYREQMPIDKGIDHTLALMREGYQYISNRRQRFRSDIFETRLLGGQKTICMAGREAAEIFYDNEKFQRRGAAPRRVRQTIFGEHAVQTLDGKAHRSRKQLLLSCMAPERLAEMIDLFKEQWQIAMQTWVKQDKIILYDEVQKIITRSVCSWTGVPLYAKELNRRTNELVALYDAAAAVGPRHWRGRAARNNAERWLGKLIGQVRQGEFPAREGTALYEVAWHKDENGALLDQQMAAIELINILRPTVAVSVYIAFLALALHDYPAEKEKLKMADEAHLHMFVQEVRRFYPFFPFAAARVRQDFLWNGYDFRTGTLVLLDLYGTNHHPRLWENPNQFYPERFKNWAGDPFSFIPQGGGNYGKDHRCPGEWLTVEMMKASLDMLVNHMEYHVPKQDLRYSMTRMPSLPKSRFVMTKVRGKRP